MALNKEEWIADVHEKLWGDGSFINEAKDMSDKVNNKTLHIPLQAGTVTVRKNLAFSNATDVTTKQYLTQTEKTITMDTFYTDQVVIRDKDIAELAYDKIELENRQSVSQLQDSIYKEAAYAWTPANSADTPITEVTGAVTGSGSNARKTLKIEDVIQAQAFMDRLNFPKEGRILVLHPEHLGDLRIQDITLFHQVAVQKKLFDFKVYTSTLTPLIQRGSGGTTDKDKVAIGGSKTQHNSISSLFWHVNQVVKIKGNVKMYSHIDNPDLAGSSFNYSVRFKADIIEAKGIGAFYGKAS